MGRKIVYNEDILREVSKQLNEYRTMVGDASGKMVNDFSGLTSHGYLTRTVGDMKKTFDSIEGFDEGGIYLRNTDDIFGGDRKAASIVEAMEVPQHFIGNNSMDIRTYNSTILEKIDGKSIKEGGAAKEGEYDDTTTVAAEDIVNLNTKNVAQSNYDDTTIIGKSVLGSINEGQVQEKEVDESTSIGNTNLRNVNNGQVTQQTFDNNKIAGERETIANINDGTESVIVGESVLGSIDPNEEKKKGEQADDAIAAALNDITNKNNVNVSDNETWKVV